ncbi:hypothetical protein BUALT_Bualt12G0105400 [Buddleja alternifolia]|uniref:Uncharacterized protein n=1 Tax=Buddleja alternifolia TaxID=168488 RepID=A0AAV6WWF7_9LAMI|nr:hypothetical protein BUALT_Bualt12G0105400 [Buddleja alternifolia]
MSIRKMAVIDEEAQAKAEVWKYAFGFVNTRVVECAIHLEIPDLLEKRGSPISLSELSSILDIPTDPLHRIMRFLAFHGIFKITSYTPSITYAQTPLSRLFTRDKMAPFMLLHESPPEALGGVSPQALRTGKRPELKSVSGEDTWTDPTFGNQKKTFTDAMSCHARSTVSAIVENYPEGYKGIKTLVDVGGRHGMALGMLVKAFPWIRGISFDLPPVVAKAPPRDGVEFIGGDMFKSVPKADAVMLMWILHDWSDEACIDILKKCKEAVQADTGKVMIIDAVINEEGEGDEYDAGRLALDMMMMTVTVKGKERTYREWAHLLSEAGFSRHTVKNIKTIESVIEAYP